MRFEVVVLKFYFKILLCDGYIMAVMFTNSRSVLTVTGSSLSLVLSSPTSMLKQRQRT